MCALRVSRLDRGGLATPVRLDFEKNADDKKNFAPWAVTKKRRPLARACMAQCLKAKERNICAKMLSVGGASTPMMRSRCTGSSSSTERI